MAETTGAYQAIFSNDLNNLKYPKILDYDAVFMNSGDGEVFSDPQVLSGLIRFVHEGGGLAGLHGASYASMDVPEFGELIGAQSGPHRTETATLKIDDPNSPLTKQFAEVHLPPNWEERASSTRMSFTTSYPMALIRVISCMCSLALMRRSPT